MFGVFLTKSHLFNIEKSLDKAHFDGACWCNHKVVVQVILSIKEKKKKKTFV